MGNTIKMSIELQNSQKTWQFCGARGVVVCQQHQHNKTIEMQKQLTYTLAHNSFFFNIYIYIYI